MNFYLLEKQRIVAYITFFVKIAFLFYIIPRFGM